VISVACDSVRKASPTGPVFRTAMVPATAPVSKKGALRHCCEQPFQRRFMLVAAP
jgi:hypothetical protein